MEPEPSESNPRSALPRTLIILLALASATIAAFGLGAIQGIVTPVFFAFVLTLCVHPLRRWMQARGISRGIATGTTIAAVFGLLTAFAAVLIASLAQFSALLPQYAPQMAEIGARISATAGICWIWPGASPGSPERVYAGPHHRVPRRPPGKRREPGDQPRDHPDDAHSYGD